MNPTFGVNQALVEDQYRRFTSNPLSVEDSWRSFFEALSPEDQSELGGEINSTNGAGQTAGNNATELAWRTSRLVTAFRSRGHYYAQIDPLELSNEAPTEFDPGVFGITPDMLDVQVATDITELPMASPRQIIDFMWNTYCGKVGVEVMHIEDREERQWVLDTVEGTNPAYRPDDDFVKTVLEGLTDAQEMELFIHTQYVGVKRFSLEGLEMVIPMLRHMIDRVGQAGVEDVVIGMAHRGRLNVLVNILKKTHHELFSAFDDKDSEELIGRGDVKYHLGHSSTHTTPTGETVHISLCFNPSHLEFVNPVVAGRVRAKMDERGEADGRGVCPIAIHGDAAFIGQGVVSETLNLAELPGYRTGGTIHIVLNNQVGFTTSPSESRSSRYASDMSRFLRVPVFHVNAEDVEAMTCVTRVATDYRQRFGRDVVIDLVGYRKFGHNEGDEPRFTQPHMYAIIDKKLPVREMVAGDLIRQNKLTAEQNDAMVASRKQLMSDALAAARENPAQKMPTLGERAWAPYSGGAESSVPDVDTAVPRADLIEMLHEITRLDESMNAHKKVKRVYDKRLKAEEGTPMDWGTAEMLAFASLVRDGHRVRITGQDTRRGTFSHRHSYVTDVETGESVTTIDRVARGRGKFEAFDSPLSEAAVLGFEYGYSLETPDDLVIWEAQFGDFANGAQVIIDQFISAGEDKWGLLTGLTMLLPHGFEGQGPEHSYARLGRFLQLCAEDNMQVVDCTTPAQFFHLLRRQVIRPWRKPLVV
ncbi:MAG: 2-oxoglutarate dehydrogenase E1 component, partial [Bradymonadia bacterium]